MPTYQYHGLTSEQKTAMAAPMLEALETRWFTNLDGEEKPLPPMALQEGRLLKRRGVDAKRHLEEKKQDVEDTVKSADAMRVIWGVEFPKGKPVTLPAGHPLLREKKISMADRQDVYLSKMDALVASGSMKEIGPSKAK